MTVLTWFLRASRSLMASWYLNLPKSMSLATGGFAIGATSTRSRSDSAASRNASSTRTMPTCSPLGPTNRTSGTRIRSLIRGSLMWFSFVVRQGGQGCPSTRPSETGKAPRHHVVREELSEQGASNQTAAYDGWQALVIRCTSATAHHRCVAPAGRTWNPATCCSELRACRRGWKRLAELLLHAVSVGELVGNPSTQPVVHNVTSATSRLPILRRSSPARGGGDGCASHLL